MKITALIPYSTDYVFAENSLQKRDKLNLNEDIHYRCLGLYLYSRNFINKYLLISPTHLEKIKSIEKLHILESRIIANTLDVIDDFVSIDNQNDLEKFRNCKQESYIG